MKPKTLIVTLVLGIILYGPILAAVHVWRSAHAPKHSLTPITGGFGYKFGDILPDGIDLFASGHSVGGNDHSSNPPFGCVNLMAGDDHRISHISAQAGAYDSGLDEIESALRRKYGQPRKVADDQATRMIWSDGNKTITWLRIKDKVSLAYDDGDLPGPAIVNTT